jgi:NitT/TauT family transport system substrate-binding protein
MFPPNYSEPVVKSEQLKWWIDVMTQQAMLQSKIDLDKLMLK